MNKKWLEVLLYELATRYPDAEIIIENSEVSAPNDTLAQTFIDGFTFRHCNEKFPY